DLPEHRFTARGAAAYVTPNDERAFACTLAQLMDDPSAILRFGSSMSCAKVHAKARSPNDERAFACTLAQLMDDPNRRMALGAYGRCRIQTQLAWEYSIPNLLSVYREVLPAAEIAE